MRLPLLVVPVVIGLALPGCYEEIGPSEEAASEVPAAGPITRTVTDGGGGSALGGAMRSANSVVDQAERASSDLAEEIERQNDE